MLTEGIRELIESASRRSGEAVALSRSLDRASALLQDSRTGNLPPPDAAAFAAAFDKTRLSELAAWREKATRIDPMGKNLEAYLLSRGAGPDSLVRDNGAQ